MASRRRSLGRPSAAFDGEGDRATNWPPSSSAAAPPTTPSTCGAPHRIHGHRQATRGAAAQDASFCHICGASCRSDGGNWAGKGVDDRGRACGIGNYCLTCSEYATAARTTLEQLEKDKADLQCTDLQNVSAQPCARTDLLNYPLKVVTHFHGLRFCTVAASMFRTTNGLNKAAGPYVGSLGSFVHCV